MNGRALFAAFAICLTTISPAGAAVIEEDVRYGEAIPLAALLLRPPHGEGPWPAAVIVQGSGTSDRTNAWARAIAELFVDRGMVILLTDKRGSGKSGGDWRSAGFDDLAADALAGVQFLRSRRDVVSSRIGVIGLSQGGWVAPLAAVCGSDVAFVVTLSSATVAFAEQSLVEMTNTAMQAGLAADGIAEVIALNHAAARYVFGGSWAEYATARERALGGPAGAIARGYPRAPEDPIWTFLKKVGNFDPLPYWSVLRQPVFFGFGEQDERDNVPVAESVRRIERIFGLAGKKDYRIAVAPGVGHGLRNAKGDFAPELLAALDEWLAAHVLRGHTP